MRMAKYMTNMTERMRALKGASLDIDCSGTLVMCGPLVLMGVSSPVELRALRA